MKAARLHAYHEQLRVEEIDEPKITEPHDVIVRIGGAGLCRTDLHIQEGQWAEKLGVELPYVLGHENAGWVHETGSAVSHLEVGDTCILRPLTAEWRGDSKGWKLSDPEARRYLAMCQELGITNIHVHTGPAIWPLNKDAFDIADVDHAATEFQEGNADLCRGLLRTLYGLADEGKTRHVEEARA